MSKPLQKISVFEKDRAWKIATAKYYNGFKMNTYNYDVMRLFNIAAGKINLTNYDYVTNPYKLKDSKYKKYPAKLLNWDIISPLFKQMLSDFRQRDFEPVVYNRDLSFDTEYEEKEKELIVDSLQQSFINVLIKSGKFDPEQTDEQGQPLEPPRSPEAIQKEMTKLVDTKTIEAQNMLAYIMDNEMLREKYIRMFYDLIVTNYTVSFKTVRNGKVCTFRVHPAAFEWVGSDNLVFFEDAEAVKTTYRFTLSEVIDLFQETLNEEEYKKEYGDVLADLEMRYHSTRQVYSGETDEDLGFHARYMKNRHHISTVGNQQMSDNKISVSHLQWTSFKRVAITYFNGEELLVDETYVENSNEKLDWFWIEETRQMYTIDEKYYIGGDCIRNERRSKIDPYKTKKEYNGFCYMSDVVQQIPLPDMLMAYQESYNVLKFKLQTTINKNKDKLAVLPIGLLASGIRDTAPTGMNSSPFDDDDDDTGEKHKGDDSESAFDFNKLTTPEFRDSRMVASQSEEDSAISKTLYYADATQMLFIDETAEGAAAALQAIKVLDLSLGNYIQWLHNYMLSIKSEAEELIGFNRFRKAQINSSDTQGNVNQGMYVGSLITDGYFDEMDSFQAVDLQGVIDLSQYAYRDGFSTRFVRNGTQVVTLRIGKDYAHADLGIFVKNSKKIKDARDIMLQQATQFLQNNMKHSTAMKMFAKMDSLSAIIEEVEKVEEEMFQVDQANKQADRDNQMNIAKMEKETSDADMRLRKYEIDVKAELELEKQLNNLISLNMATGNEDIAKNLENNRAQIIADFQKANLEREKLALDDAKNVRDNATKRYVADTSLRVAKENKPAKK